jgi:hypothetical protein
VRVAIRPGISEARVRLDPAGLGVVSVRLSLEGGTLRGVLTTEKPETGLELERRLPELKAALARDGVVVSHLEVVQPRAAPPVAGALGLPAGASGGGPGSRGGERPSPPARTNTIGVAVEAPGATEDAPPARSTGALDTMA